MNEGAIAELLHIPSSDLHLEGMLELPTGACGLVLFAHGSGSSRLSPRNNSVAAALRSAGLGTLLMDLLTGAEDATYETRFDIPLLTGRLGDAARHIGERVDCRGLAIGLFGASTGAAAALQLAAAMPERIAAVVSRGGRPDLAGAELIASVKAPTLLIVGGLDHGVIELNQAAWRQLRCRKELKVVPGATHLFEEPGALTHVAQLASDWFIRHLLPAKGCRQNH